jgi:hypothetical protein
MSAFPSIATELRTSLEVRFVPILLQKSKIDRPENLARVDFWTTLPLQSSPRRIRGPVVGFVRNDAHAKRISGHLNFRSSPEKDFFNTICQEATSRPPSFEHLVGACEQRGGCIR